MGGRRLRNTLLVLQVAWCLTPVLSGDGINGGGVSVHKMGSFSSDRWMTTGFGGNAQDIKVYMALAERSKDPAFWQGFGDSIQGFSTQGEYAFILREYEERLSRWVKKRWEEGAPEFSLSPFARALERANRRYTLLTDEGGDTLFDEAGDPVLKGAEGVAEDETAWKDKVSREREELLRSWEQRARVECQEILSTLSGVPRQVAERTLELSVAEYREGIERELDRLERQGAIRFLQARLQDQFSLRRKSEGNTAEALAVSLIAKTEEELRIAALRLAQSVPSQEEGRSEVRLDPSAWQEEFKREFEQGIALWKKAEERFLQERIRWETEAQRSYLQAEQSWDMASQEFLGRRNQWLEQMRGLLESGRIGWREQKERFLLDYEKVMQRLAGESKEELEKFRKETASWIGMYDRSLELVEMAEENGSFIQGEIDRWSARVNSLNGEISSFLSEISHRQTTIESILSDPPVGFRPFIDSGGVRYTILEYEYDKRWWYGPFVEFLESSGYPVVWFNFSDGYDGYYSEPGVPGEAPWVTVRAFNEGARKEELDPLRREIQDLQAREIAPRVAERDQIANVRVPALQGELAYWLGPGGVRERFEATRLEAARSVYALAEEAKTYGIGNGLHQVGPDALSREIERTRKLLSLQETQLEIAKQVLSYAKDTSSNRPTEAETGETLEQTFLSLSEAEERYRASMFRLESHLTGTIAEAQRALERAKATLASTTELLESAKKTYEEALSAYRSGNSSVLLALIDEYERKISLYYGQGEGSRKGLWERYMPALEYVSRMEWSQQVSQVLRDLEGASDLDDFTDISVLHRQWEKLKSLSLPWEEEVDLQALSVRLVMAGVSAEKVDGLTELYQAGREGNLLARWKAEVIREGMVQEAALSLHEAEWIRDFLRLGALSAAAGEALLRGYETQRGEAELRYKVARLRVEREALSVLLDGDSSVSAEAKELATLIEVHAEDSYRVDRRRLEELSRLEGWWLQRLREGLEAEGTWVEELDVCLTKSPFSTDGTDLVELFVGEAWLEAGKAALEAELSKKYAYVAPALSTYVREELSRRIEVALQGADLGRLEGALLFLRSLPPIEQVPGYVIDALSRVVALSLLSKGLDPLNLPMAGGTEGNESVLSYVQSIQEGYKNLCLSGAYATYPEVASDLHAYKNFLVQGLQIFRSSSSLPPVSMEEANRFREDLLRGERRILATLESKRRIAAEFQVFQQGKEVYKSQVLDPKLRELEHRFREVEIAKQGYQEAITSSGRAITEYTRLVSLVDQEKVRYEEARVEAQKAEAIHQYASMGYTVPGYTPEELVAERSERLRVLREVVSFLESLRTQGQLPFRDRMEPTYGTAMSQEQTWLACSLYLDKAAEEVAKESHALQNEMGTVLFNLERQVQQIIAIPRLMVDPTVMAAHTLVDLRTEDEEGFAARVEAYFSGSEEEVCKRFSVDALQWVKGIVSRGDGTELLRKFGLAYYYDTMVQGDLRVAGAAPIASSLLQDPSWVKLTNDYVGLGPVTIPVYEYSADEAVIVGYETFYPEPLWTVEDYLSNKTREVYQSILSDGELWKSYAFFKMMVATNRLKEGSGFIGKDVGDLVFFHVDGPAESMQRSYLKWWRFWTHAEGRRIRALREDIARVHDTGAEERTLLFQGMEAVAVGEKTRASIQKQLDSLVNTPQEVGSFLDMLTQKTGTQVSLPLESLIRNLFPLLDAGQKKDNGVLLQTIIQAVDDRALYYRSQANQRAEVLSAQWNSQYNRYASLLEQIKRGVSEGPFLLELQSLAEQLFLNPSFTWDDHFMLGLELSENLSSYTRSGVGMKLKTMAEKSEALFKGRLSVIQEGERIQALRELSLLKEREEEWERQMEALYQTGGDQWKEQLSRLYGLRKRWQEEFGKDFEESEQLWEGKYALLLKSREEWVQKLCQEAVTAGTAGMAAKFGLERERLLGEVEQVRVPDLWATKVANPGHLLRQIVSDALFGQSMEKLLDQAGRITSRIEKDKPIIAAYLPNLRNQGDSLGRAQRFADEIGEEIHRKAALVSALKMGSVFEDAQRNAKEKIVDANRDVDKHVSETLRGAGYQREGKLFTRRAIIDETLLGGIERETQQIEGYRFFVAPTFTSKIDLTPSSLEGKSGDHIQAMVLVAQKELSRYMELLFGRNKDQTWNWDGLEDLRQSFIQSEQGYKASEGYERNPLDGLFHWHVGYVPLMDPSNPEVVREEGFGEMGRIFALFFRNQARQSRGLASFDVPWYNRKLYDDDADNDGKSDGWFSSPTIRSLTNIAVSVVSSATMSPWLAAAVNLLDDALFSAMDAGNGMGLGGAGWVGLAKQAGISALSAGLGAAATSLDQTLTFGKGLAGGVLETASDLGITTLKTLGTAYGRAALESLSVNQRGISFDANTFSAMTSWNDVGTSLGIELVRTGVQSGLQSNIRGYLGTTYSNATALHGLAANLSANAVEYALRGSTQFNLLNMNQFSDSYSGGLLELTLGGKAQFSVGQGGTDISLGTLAQGLRGLDAYFQNRRMVKAGIRDDLVTAMRVLYSNGQGDGRTLYEEVLIGKSRVVFEDNAEYEARTIRDQGSNTKVVHVRRREGRDSDLELGVVLSHESFRNGLDDGKELQEMETRRAVERHMAVATQIALTYGMGVLNEKLQKEVALFKHALSKDDFSLLRTYISQAYESTKDYWKLLRDGTLINDGDSRLWIEIMNDDGSRGWQLVEGSKDEKSVSAALFRYLGKERALELLGKKPDNIDLYDAQTLKDVLKVSDEEIALMRKNPVYAASRLRAATEEQMEMLVGEALMKKAGIQWNASKQAWIGEGDGIRISKYFIPGNAMIRHVGGKQYERFSVTGEIVRHEGAYDVWMDGMRKDVSKGNTSLVFKKWNLDTGKVKETYVAEGAWNSVDNSTGQRDQNGNPIGVHQPYQFAGGPLVQGNTLAAGSLNLRWAQADSRNFKEVLIISDAKTIAGEKILSNGLGADHPHEGRWLIHFTGYGTSDGCIVSVGEEGMKKLMQALKNMGITRGYVISSKLEDRNQFARGQGYKQGNW